MKLNFLAPISMMALLCTFASCNQQKEDPVTPLAVTGTLGNTADLALSWAAGDVIYGYTTSEAGTTEVSYKAAAAGTSTSFEAAGTFDEPATGSIAYMVYSPSKASLASGAYKFDFASQDGMLESAKKTATIFTATGTVLSSKLDLSFSGQMALVCIPSVSLPHDYTPETLKITGVPAGCAISSESGKMALKADDASSISVKYNADGTYFAIPAGNYEGVDVIAVYNGTEYPVIEGKSATLSANAIANWDTTPIVIKYWFSISETEKVIFAKGNLYNDGTNWKFEENQYDFRNAYGFKDDVAVIDGKETTTPENSCGCFYWSDVNNGIAGSYTAPTGTSVNWGTDAFNIENGDGREWFTLNADQLAYLFDSRENADKLIAKCTVTTPEGANVTGLVIFPDGCTVVPEGLTTYTFECRTSNAVPTYYASKVFTAEEWKFLEEEGAVFLPTAGYATSKNAVTTAGTCGGYWSSSPASRKNNAVMLSFEETEKINRIHPALGSAYTSARSVRLVSKYE